MAKKIDQFNIVINGVGGQGLITLLQVIAEAALSEGYDIKTSELHGLSQRGGSVEVHVRFGKKIYSPLVAQGKADLAISLELQESLRSCYYAGSQTTFLVNKQVVAIPLQKSLSEAEVVSGLKKASKKVKLIPASEICQKNVGTSVVAGIYLISLACFKEILPLKPASVLKAIKKTIPAKYLELNEKVFSLAKKG